MQIAPQLQQQLAQAMRTSMRIERYRTRTLPQVQAQAQALMAQQHICISAAHNPKMPPLTATGLNESDRTT